jgi:hypothetical protein
MTEKPRPASPQRRKNRRPTQEQLDERVTIPLDPEAAIQAIMETGPHPEPKTDEKPKRKKPAGQ